MAQIVNVCDSSRQIMENKSGTLFASAARTADHQSDDQTNYSHRGIQVIIDVTLDPANASVVFTIQGKDPASGEYFTLLESAAIAAVGTTILRVFPGATAANNLVANDFLPKVWRVDVNHTDTDTITYSVGYNLLA